jgi:hypothetical protein
MKKLSNKILVIVLLVLAAAFALSRTFRSPGLESTLPPHLVTVDTAKITTIKISAASDSSEVTLRKEDKGWFAEQAERKVKADEGLVRAMLRSLSGLRPERLASRKREKWETYNVTDRGARLAVFYDDNKKADIRVGKTGYSSGGAYTYVRLNDEDEVYAIAGALSGEANRTFNDWRNKSLLRVNKDAIRKITFRYPADSSFVLDKRDSLWYADGENADAAKVSQYLSKLAFRNGTIFTDDFKNEVPATLSMQIEGETGTLATVKAWQRNAEWVVSGSQQEKTYFVSDTAFVNELFIAKQKILPDRKK